MYQLRKFSTSVKTLLTWVEALSAIKSQNYEKFLRKANGLEFNGLVIYNAKLEDENNGFCGANEIWRDNEWDSDYLFFGDLSISWYCLDIDNYVFLELDKPSGDIVNE